MNQEQLNNKIISLVKDQFPVKNNKYEIDIDKIEIKSPDALGSIKKEYDLKANNKSLNGQLLVSFVLKENGKVVSKTNMHKLLDVPYKSLRGTYIVNGIEKIVSNQLRSIPGPYTKTKSGGEVETQISFPNFNIPPIKMTFDKDKAVLKVNVGGKNFSGYNFLKYIGFSDAEIQKAVGDDEFGINIMKNKSGGEGKLADLYKILVVGKYGTKKMPTDEKLAILDIQNKLSDNVINDQKSLDVIQTNIGYSGKAFDNSAISLSVKKLLDVARGTKQDDNRDDLIFQQALTGEDLIFEQIKKDVGKISDGANAVISTGDISNIIKMFNGFGKSANSFLVKGQLSEMVDETNPLHLMSSGKKITIMGEGGMSEDALKSSTSVRNLKDTGMNRLDPVHTPESFKIGAVNFLAQDANIKDGVITAKFYKVLNKSALKIDTNIVELSPKQEYDSYIAFHDKRYIVDNGSSLTFKKGVSEVPGRYHGSSLNVPIEKIQYIDKAPQDIFDIPANLIPFGHHNDGNRMLMGANMQTQAITLVNREEPLVQVKSDNNKTYEEIVGENSFIVKSPVSGTVTKVTGDTITIKDAKGKENNVEIYDYFPLNMDHFLNNEPTVKVGDTVKKDDLIAEGWDTKNGKLALGLNTRIGFMPFNGYNHEDGIVVSESYADKAATEETYVRDVEIKQGHIGGFGSNAKQLLKEYIRPAKSLDKLDNDGIIKVGSEINPGDILVARLKEIKQGDMNESLSLLSRLTGVSVQYRDASEYIPSTGYTKGKVLRVEKKPSMQGGKECIRILISQIIPLKKGDKVAGRHGNKGTITEIVADKDMPRTEDGKPLELLFSPLAIPSRKNLGQLLETNAGLIAEKEGKTFKVSNFDPASKEEVMNELKKIGVPDGKVNVIDPETGKPYDNKVTVGNMYIMRLKHKADDKIQSRSTGDIQLTYMEPKKVTGGPAGEKQNPQKLGEMEMWSLQSHGAVNNILEATTLKGDGAGDIAQRGAIFRYLSGENKLDSLENFNSTPESLRLFNNYTTAMGIDVVPIKNNKRKTINDDFSELLIRPAKDKDLVRLIGKDNKVVAPDTYKIKNDNDIEVDGGLFDEKIFGNQYNKDDRDKWGYIELTSPVPNPLLMKSDSYNVYEYLTGVKSSDLNNLMKNKYVLITNPGDTGLGKDSIVPTDKNIPGINKTLDELEVEGKLVEYKVGGEALLYLLKKIDVDKFLKETEKELKTAKGKNTDKLYRKYRMLKSLKDNKLSPEDLMTNIVPVLPTFMRPRMQSGKQVKMDNINELYKRLVRENNDVANTLGDKDTQLSSTLAKDSAALYDKVENLYGVTKYVDPKTKEEYKGIKDILNGKEGLVHEKMLSKKVDYSGRSIIGLDPTLQMDEIGLPLDMARELYKPFIIKELVKSGVAKNHTEAEAMVRSNSPEIRKAAIKVCKNRPVILNRAPSLHKLSIQAFDPIIRDYDDTGRPIRTMQLNPLVTKGFNADFDGDQMAAHIPLTDKAVREANELLKPSKNLLSVRNGELNIDFKHEMLLGVYYLTMDFDKPTTKQSAKSYSSYDELYKDWISKNINVRDLATLKGTTATVGQLLANFIIPDKFSKYRDFKKVLGKGEMKKLFTTMIEDENVSNADVVSIINKFKDLGFKASTKSALSIGINDFAKPADLNKRIEDVINSVDNEVSKDNSKLIAGFRDLETKLEDDYNKGNILDSHNPVQIMMRSGARGNAQQVRRMTGIVGIGRDVTGKQTLPVLNAHIDGLSPEEFWLHSFDSRKGMYDRAVSTIKPGEFTKNTMVGTQDVVVVEHDCHTTEGTKIIKTNKTIIGRFATIDIKGSDGIIVRAGDNISKNDFDKINKDDSIQYVWVRSPMKCKSVKGICQKCYGYLPNTKTLAKIGDAVGVTATQAIGEPLSQGTMNTFHTGAAGSQTTLGLPRIKDILSAKTDPDNIAVLSKASGIVKIDKINNKTVVYVGNVPHTIGLAPDGAHPKELRVKNGDFVNKGDFLTVGNSEDILTKDTAFTNANPSEFLTLNMYKGPEKALDETKEYMANTLEYAVKNTIGDGTVDRRHLEVAVSRNTSKVRITDAGSSPFMPGQIVEKNEVDMWNGQNAASNSIDEISVTDVSKLTGRTSAQSYKDIVKKGDTLDSNILGKLMIDGLKTIRVKREPAQYNPEIMGLSKSVTDGHDNWLSNVGYHDVGKQLARGMAYGQKDDLSTIRSRQMTGNLLNIGEGRNIFDKFKDKANSFKNSLINMFQ